MSIDKVKRHCAMQGAGISAVLSSAGVSRNAFYALARKPSIVPGSLRALAATLGVAISALLEDAPPPAERMQELARAALRIAQRTGADADNVRHALLLLDEPPVERLRRALRRGRPINLR